jgi:hypothetical protein
LWKNSPSTIPEEKTFLWFQFAGQGTFELEGVAIDDGEVEPTVGIEVCEFTAVESFLENPGARRDGGVPMNCESWDIKC